MVGSVMVKREPVYFAWLSPIRLGLVCLGLLILAPAAFAQTVPPYTRADSIRGSLTAPERTWWDVTFYDLNVAVNPADSTIAGWNAITYRVVGEPTEMQINLQAPLVIDSIVQDGRGLLPRQAARRAEPAVGRRLHVDDGREGPAVGLDVEPGARRERVVAEQGHRLGGAGQPARGGPRAGPDDPCRERAAAERDE